MFHLPVMLYIVLNVYTFLIVVYRCATTFLTSTVTKINSTYIHNIIRTMVSLNAGQVSQRLQVQIHVQGNSLFCLELVCLMCLHLSCLDYFVYLYNVQSVKYFVKHE